MSMPLLFPFHPHPLGHHLDIFFFLYKFKPFIGWWGLGGSIIGKKADHFTTINPCPRTLQKLVEDCMAF